VGADSVMADKPTLFQSATKWFVVAVILGGLWVSLRTGSVTITSWPSIKGG
jgi:hypothetical protein